MVETVLIYEGTKKHTAVYVCTIRTCIYAYTLEEIHFTVYLIYLNSRLELKIVFLINVLCV